MATSQRPPPQSCKGIGVLNMRQRLIAATAVAAGILCFLALLAYDDRELVWHEGGLLEIGQFVEVAPATSMAPSSPASSSVDGIAP